MQFAQITGIGLLILGGLFAVLLRSNSGGVRSALLQVLAGIGVGLLGAFVVLTLMTDLIPDQIEWIGTVAIVAVGAATAIAIRFWTRR